MELNANKSARTGLERVGKKEKTEGKKKKKKKKKRETSTRAKVIWQF
jgi:hypothetical protein